MKRSAPEGITLADLGWPPDQAAAAEARPGLSPARVSSVYAALVDLWTPEGPRLASLRSKALRRGPEGGIAVGDWALVAALGEGTSEVVVEDILPRRTVFLRQAAGERSEPQAIAANVDRVFIVTAADADFNVRRLERYLVAVAAGGAEAQIVLTKADLAIELEPLLEQARALAPAFATSAKAGSGIDELARRIPRGTTATVVGSSGVGKSALVNRLLGGDVQREGAVRAHDGRGRHTTTRRQLFMIPDAGLLIDTPGMRELKPWLPEGAPIDDAFDDVRALAERCRYRDCAHAGEPGCAVEQAARGGTLAEARLEAFRKLSRERAELAPRQATFAAAAERRRDRTMAVALRKRAREKR